MPHDFTHLLAILVAVILATKVLGEVAQRIAQPSVLGELVAGVLLGCSLLGRIAAYRARGVPRELPRDGGIDELVSGATVRETGGHPPPVADCQEPPKRVSPTTDAGG